MTCWPFLVCWVLTDTQVGGSVYQLGVFEARLVKEQSWRPGFGFHLHMVRSGSLCDLGK